MTRTLALLCTMLAGCATVTDPEAFTLAALADDGVVALTWDGDDACVYHGGRISSCFHADSAPGALWGWDEPGGDTYTSPKLFSEVLEAEEIAALEPADLAP